MSDRCLVNRFIYHPEKLVEAVSKNVSIKKCSYIHDTYLDLYLPNYPATMADEFNSQEWEPGLYGWNDDRGCSVNWKELESKRIACHDLKSEDEALHNPVNQPSHYTHGTTECIDIIRDLLGDSGFIAFCRGNAIKYQYRAGLKGEEGDEAQDLAKAAWYSQMAAHVIAPDSYNDPRKLRNTQKK